MRFESLDHPPALFAERGELSDHFQQRSREALAAAAALLEGALAHSSDDELAASIIERFRAEPPHLDLASQALADKLEDTQIDVRGDFQRGTERATGPVHVPGIKADLRIPFSGDERLFQYTASTRSDNRPRGRIIGSEVSLVALSPKDTLSLQGLKADLDNQVANLARYTGWTAQDCDSFNAGLDSAVRHAVARRRAELGERAQIQAGLRIPVRRRADASPAFEPAVQRKPVSLKVPSRTPAAARQRDPELEPSVFAEILTQLTSARKLIERLPSTFSGMQEETIRDILLVLLNNQFGIGAAEAFSGAGKTDIMILGRDKPVFIAECKFWTGDKGFREALDQLLGYLVWRDTAAALVLFVRRKNISDVETKAIAAVRNYPQFVRDAATLSECPTFSLQHDGDPARKLRVALLIVPVPRRKPLVQEKRPQA